MSISILAWIVVAGAISALLWYRFSIESGLSIEERRKRLAEKVDEAAAKSGGAKITSFKDRDVMMAIISIAVLLAALFIILSGRYDSGSEKWAFGAVGSIVGFWLKPGK